MELGGLNRLLKVEGRKDGGEPLGEHTLSGTRRSDEKDVVPARRGDFQRPLGLLLPLDLRQVEGEFRHALLKTAPVEDCGLKRLLPGEMVDQLPHVLDPEDLGAGGDRRLPSVFGGDEKPGFSGLPGGEAHTEHAPHAFDLS